MTIRQFGLALALGLVMFWAGPTTSGAQQPQLRPCCDDPWDPGTMHRDRWHPNRMGPIQRQRMFRHWTFMNQGVPQEYRGVRNPLSSDSETIAAGAAIYAANCARCHGDHGYGDGELGRGLSPSPALLAQMVRFPMAIDEYLLWAISDGGAPFGTEMPAFKDRLSADDIWKVIIYMRAGFPQTARNE